MDSNWMAQAQGANALTPQTAASDALQTQSQTAGIAYAHEQHLQAVQDFQNNQKVFAEKQGAWAADQMGNILSIQNPQMRQLKFKQFQKTAQVAGVNVDPAFSPLLNDDDFIRNAQEGMARANNLPYDQRTAAMMSMQGMLGNAADAEKNIYGTMGQLATQKYTTNVQAQAAGLQRQFEMTKTGVDYGKDLSNSATTQNKENIELLRNSNTILEAAANPALRKDAYANEQVKQLLSKITNPGGVIRESEIKEWEHAFPGIGQAVKGYLKAKTGEGSLTDQQWNAIQDLTQRAAMRVQGDVNNQKVAAKNLYGKFGVDVDSAFGAIPKIYGAPGTDGAQVAQRGAQAPAAAPQPLHPAVQSAAQARMQSFGIDPSAPDAMNQLVAKLQGSTGPSAPQTAQAGVPAASAAPTDDFQGEVAAFRASNPDMSQSQLYQKAAKSLASKHAKAAAGGAQARSQAASAQFTQRESASGRF